MSNINLRQASAERGQIQPSTSCEWGKPASLPSGEIQILIGELGLRYRPAAAADLEAHAARLALLATDLADVQPALLDTAIRQWVRQSRFMPTAAELFSIMDAERERRRPRPAPEPIATAETMIEGPVEVIPPEEIRAMTADFVKMGLKKGWITQAQVDAAFAA